MATTAFMAATSTPSSSATIRKSSSVRCEYRADLSASGRRESNLTDRKPLLMVFAAALPDSLLMLSASSAFP